VLNHLHSKVAIFCSSGELRFEVPERERERGFMGIEEGIQHEPSLQSKV